MGTCGTLHVGGNAVVMYGIEPIDCSAVETRLTERIDRRPISIQSGACWLVGEEANARFNMGCNDISDQYDSRMENKSTWVVPNSIQPTLEPARDETGAIVANVWMGEQNLQIWLISEGLARVTCEPERVKAGYDTCERLHAAE